MEYAALTSTESTKTLSLVCKAAHAWMVPLHWYIAKFPRTRTLLQYPALSLAERLHGLHVTFDNLEPWPIRKALFNLLLAAQNVKHLAINPVHLMDITKASHDLHCISMRPDRLVLFGDPQPLSQPHPLFRAVTHLSIYAVSTSKAVDPEVFPKLAHCMILHNFHLDRKPTFLESMLRIRRRDIERDNGLMDVPESERMRFDGGLLVDSLQLLVVNLCDSSFVPHIPDILQRHERVLLSERILLVKSTRLTAAQWEQEARSDLCGDPAMDRWRILEEQLHQQRDALGVIDSTFGKDRIELPATPGLIYPPGFPENEKAVDGLRSYR